MKILSFRVLSVLMSTVLLISCMKEEKPYPLPVRPIEDGDFEMKNEQVHMGESYEKQIFFSFANGTVVTVNNKDWDIALTTEADAAEIWMNGGKEVLFYPTGSSDFASVQSVSGLDARAWKYDNPSWLPGTSALGALSEGNHLNEVIIVNAGGGTFYKLQVKAVTSESYTLVVGPLSASQGETLTLLKDANYNYIYYSFENGAVTIEPPKKDWDIVFTRYRHVYWAYNDDGSDFLYQLNGVLTNPYKTLSGDDSAAHDFYEFDLAAAEPFELLPDRDIIGFDWKTANINTGQYKVDPKRVFVVKDQNEMLWKLHFVSFYDENNVKGSPRFEYQRLK